MDHKPVVIFAFRGDPMCFIHVLLNALDLNQKGRGGRIILEGETVSLVDQMRQPGSFLNPLYTQAKDAEIIAGACKACSAKLGAEAAITEEGILLIGEMSGHPAMSEYLDQGYDVITF